MSAAPADGGLAALLTPEAVRSRCGEVFDAGRRGELEHFTLDLAALGEATARVLSEIRRNYPQGEVPVHSRWRHFEPGGRDLWREVAAAHTVRDTDRLARSRFDLAMVSVLLDAGAGAAWRYRDAPTGLELGRSEGLALASLRLFESGLLSAAGAADPLRVDAQPLAGLSDETLAGALQASAHNPLPGLAQRAELLRRLGRTLLAGDKVFERDGVSRPGHLYDHLRARADERRLPAREILIALLAHLGEIWPEGRVLGGIRMGDVGNHPAVRRADASDGLVPFHKLSQWLAYSLMEPLAEAGLRVTEPDALTGLPEYRNGGLLLDTGVLRLRDESQQTRPQPAEAALVVEWRALTVALLDRLAAHLRERIGCDAAHLPLASVLQGGTWSAGRRIAAELREGGAPPLEVVSNGTLF